MIHQVITSYWGAPASSVTIAVQDWTATNSTTVDQDVTTSAMSGLTPKAALLINSLHLSTNDPGETATASFMMGVQANSAAAAYTMSRDNLSNTGTLRGAYNNRCLQGITAGSTLSPAATGTLITEGIRLNYSATITNQRGQVVLFGGDDVQAHSGIVSLGTGTSAITVSGLGFQPDVVIIFGCCGDFANGGTNAFGYTFGFATSDGAQRCVMGAEPDNAVDGRPYQIIRNDAVAGQVGNNGSGLTYKVTLSNFGSDGFDATPSASAGSDEVAYLALKFGGRAAKIVDFDTPTSTGGASITGVGFTPQFMLAVLTNLESVNNAATASDDLQSGLGISFIGNEQWSTTIRIDSGAATTDTGSNMKGNAIMGANATSTAAIIASLTNFDSDGAVLNYSAVQGAAKKGFALAIQ